jgi:RNase P subunit RPR2
MIRPVCACARRLPLGTDSSDSDSSMKLSVCSVCNRPYVVIVNANIRHTNVPFFVVSIVIVTFCLCCGPGV